MALDNPDIDPTNLEIFSIIFDPINLEIFSIN